MHKPQAILIAYTTHMMGSRKQLDTIFIHFGAHKTGTSYLQHVFAKNKRFFKKQNSLFIHPRYGEDAAIRALKKWQRGDFSHTPAPRAFTDYFDKLSALGKESVFVSSESLLGTMNLAATKQIYPAARIVMKTIKNQLSDQQIKVAFSMRNYADFIESTYKWKVGDGLPLSFDDYLAQIDLKQLSWNEVIQALIDVYGKENVIVWEYENYRRNPEDIHQKLLHFFYGNDISIKISYPKFTTINVSPNEKYLMANRAFNEAVASLDFLSGKQKRQIRTQLHALLRDTIKDDNARPVLLDATTRKTLDARYKNDLSKMKKLLGKQFI
jgi:hypothetical protein